MVKKLSKRQLMDQCGFSAEETKVILEYQKRLPILVENDNVEGFCVNARDLYVQLRGSDLTNFTRWFKRALKNYRFEENIDFTTISPIGRIATGGGDIKSQNYLFTIDISKQLAMVEKTDIGVITRRYFILMEDAVKRNLMWEIIRQPLREGYKKMQAALNDYMNRTIQKDADEWDYKFEADAINTLATGFRAKEIRLFMDCKDNITRDSLTATYNEYLLKLQELNIIYLGMNMNRYERYKMLKDSFDILFPNAVPIKDDVDIKRIIENKNKLIEEMRQKVQRVA